MTWQTLAPELIFEVFKQFLPEFKKLSTTKPGIFPWYLGHICRTWRDVFLSSPQFWNTLEIEYGLYPKHESDEAARSILEIERISMDRSRNYPISFRLFLWTHPHRYRAMFPACRQIIEVLIANSTRWRDVYINIPAFKMASIYPAKNRMPLLRSISLVLQTKFSSRHESFSDSAIPYNDFLVDAVQLTRICFNENIPFWKVNWSLITVAHFFAIPPCSQLLSYLPKMTCLTELAFLGTGYFKTEAIGDDGIAPVALPHLKKLYSPIVTLLSILMTPALRELQIRNDLSSIKDENVLLNIISRFTQSTCQLSRLVIFPTDWKDAAIIIEQMPWVDDLTILYYPVYVRKPTDLFKSLENCQQIRFLKKVTFLVKENLKPEGDGLLEIVTSWKRETGENKGIGPFHNLTKMSFELWNCYSECFADRVKLHLEKQGIHCYILGQPERYLLDPPFDGLWKYY